MSCTVPFHSSNIQKRAGLARQLLLAGAALLLAGSAFAQTPAKSEKAPRILTVTDSVQLVGSKISGGWREHAADGSWRRVEFALDREAASVTFGDGEPGRRLPSATRYAYAGHGGKNAKAGDAPAVYSEALVFAGAAPGIRDRANQSSPVPDDVATRVRELGGDIKLMQQATDLKRISELGSAFDAAGSRAADDRFFGDRPGGPPRRSGGGWKDPRAGVGRDGRAGDEVVSVERTDGTDGSYEAKVVTRDKDGSTTEFRSWRDADGSHGDGRTERDAHGNVTEGSSRAVSANGDTNSMRYTHNPKTGEIIFHTSPPRTTPSEVPFSGRGGFDEAWMDKSLPWFMDALYTNWKRKNDLVRSGGMISQPGRDEDPSPGAREGPRVGASAVTNCGDTGTNPCARFEGTETDARAIFGKISQPLPDDGPTGGPLGGTGGPLGGTGGPLGGGGGPSPVPNPQLKP